MFTLFLTIIFLWYCVSYVGCFIYYIILKPILDKVEMSVMDDVPSQTTINKIGDCLVLCPYTFSPNYHREQDKIYNGKLCIVLVPQKNVKEDTTWDSPDNIPLIVYEYPNDKIIYFDHDVKNSIEDHKHKIKTFEKGKEYFFHVTWNGLCVTECTRLYYCTLWVKYNWQIILSICSVIGSFFTILSFFK